MPQSRGQRSLFQHVCSWADLERLEANLGIVAAAQVSGGWENADMACVSSQDCEEAAVGRYRELSDDPW